MVDRVGSLQRMPLYMPATGTLIEWYGLPLVEWLEGPHEAKHYSKEDLEEIAAKYRRKTRELKKQRAA
jgi:hypothetical protein